MSEKNETSTKLQEEIYRSQPSLREQERRQKEDRRQSDFGPPVGIDERRQGPRRTEEKGLPRGREEMVRYIETHAGSWKII